MKPTDPKYQTLAEYRRLQPNAFAAAAYYRQHGRAIDAEREAERADVAADPAGQPTPPEAA